MRRLTPWGTLRSAPDLTLEMMSQETTEETKPWQPYFVLTLPFLSSQRHIENQCAGRIGISPGYNDDGPHLGRHPQVGEPHFTGVRCHQ